MRSTTLSVCSILFCLSIVGCGEKPWYEQDVNYDPRTLQPIGLFMTREEVRELWGEPDRYFYGHIDFKPLRVTRKYFSREEYDEAVKQYGALQDVYYRKTPRDRYEIRIGYKEDPIANPDQSDKKVYEVVFYPAAAHPIDFTLKDLVEVMGLCQAECGMQAHEVSVSVEVYPNFPTADQRNQTARMARIWAPDSYRIRGEKADWLPVVNLVLQMEQSDLDSTIQEVEWMRRPVSTVVLGFSTPRWDLRHDREARMGRKQRVMELGSFHPPSEAQEKESESK